MYFQKKGKKNLRKKETLRKMKDYKRRSTEDFAGRILDDPIQELRILVAIEILLVII